MMYNAYNKPTKKKKIATITTTTTEIIHSLKQI